MFFSKKNAMIIPTWILFQIAALFSLWFVKIILDRAVEELSTVIYFDSSLTKYIIEAEVDVAPKKRIFCFKKVDGSQAVYLGWSVKITHYRNDNTD